MRRYVWSDDGEVASVERGDLGGLGALGESDDRGVDEAEPKVLIDLDQADRSQVVVAFETDDRERGLDHGAEEPCLCGRPQS